MRAMATTPRPDDEPLEVENVVVPVIKVATRETLHHRRYDATPSRHMAAEAVANDLDPARVRSVVSGLIADLLRMDGKDHAEIEGADSIGSFEPGSLLLLQGMTVEVSIRARAALVPYDTWTEEERQRIADTVHRPDLDHMVAKRLVQRLWTEADEPPAEANPPVE